MSGIKEKPLINEDWTSVLLGALIIVLAILGLTFNGSEFDWKDSSDLLQIFSSGNISLAGVQFMLVFGTAILGAVILRKPLRAFVPMFIVVYLITFIALILTGNAFMKSINLEAVIFSLGLGLLIGNAFNMPVWFRQVLSTELFVKIGLVLLGTSIIFSNILQAGALGLAQALVVVLTVWYFAFWLCKRLGIDQELTMMISSAVSICGVSAAIATSGAIEGDSKKLSYVISMVLITAIPMMIFMPMIAVYFGLSDEVTGAWLGGSIDTTGAVVASGSLVGETALKISTIVKFSQNVLLGIAAFAISVYWTYTGKRAGRSSTDKQSGLKVIWERFPKFVIGFIGASLLFSFLLNDELVAEVKGSLKSVQGLWFALAFTSIGLETNFRELFINQSRKPFYAFLIAQLFNVIVTLIVASILFRS